MHRPPLTASSLALVALLALTSCGPDEAANGPRIGRVAFDYQLGGAYPPPEGVGLVVRDRTAAPAAGLTNVCYVNGFQTQPDERRWWLAEHPDLLLRGEDGEPVVDPDWPDELLLDVTTPARRAAIAEIVGRWVDGCAADGYDAVEIDNLDSYLRSGGAITEDHAAAAMALVAERAHAAGLLVGHKNAVELLERRAEMGGLDFAVSEECNRFEECDGFLEAYGTAVLVIEYDAVSFAAGCERFGDEVAIVRRDLDLTTPADSAYVYDRC